MREALLRIAVLFSYCGGPLFISDVLKRRLGPGVVPFLITFLPVGVMVYGAFWLREDIGDRWARAFVWAGRQALYVVLGMHAYAVWCFAQGVRKPDQALHYIGIAAGVVWSVAYLHEARRWAASPDAADHAVGRSSSDPIEPS